MNIRIPESQGKFVISRATTDGSVIILLLGVSSNCVHFTIFFFFFAKRRVGNSLLKGDKIKKTHKEVTHELPNNCRNFTSYTNKYGYLVNNTTNFLMMFIRG